MLLNLQGWKSKMATTSIWAVKDNLDRVLNYASNPLKTKETDSGYEYEGLENVIDYAVNDDKTERQLYVSGLNCHPSTVLQQMEQKCIISVKKIREAMPHKWQNLKTELMEVTEMFHFQTLS